MLQNARVTIFTFSELLRENQQGSGGGGGGGGQEIALHPPRLGLLLNLFIIKLYLFLEDFAYTSRNTYFQGVFQ